METLLKQLVKEAVLEALNEYYGESEEVATWDGKKDNGLSDENSGGTPGKGNRPKPDVGVGVWSLR